MAGTPKTSISRNDYLRLLGLLTLAKDHNKALSALQRSAEEITGETGDGTESGNYGHTADAIYDEGSNSIDALLRKLGITVEMDTL
ncbi:MAG: hypothetical protein ACRYFS_10330 [Janthinobacterium lividum]